MSIGKPERNRNDGDLKRNAFFGLLDYLMNMNDRGYIKENVVPLLKEAYYFTHGEDDT